MRQETEKQIVLNIQDAEKIRTTIALQRDTKKKIDKIRAPGQCYDGVINELVEYWERYRIGSSLCGPGKPVYNNSRE